MQSQQQSLCPSLPSFELAIKQSRWLRAARTRLLRNANIHRAKQVVDLACGWGQNSAELIDRCQAEIIGIDLQQTAIEGCKRWQSQLASGRLSFVQADAHHLPLEDASQDLVFVQCGLLWMQTPENVVQESGRVLRPGGCLVAIEPDYGGLMEFPSTFETRDIWIDALIAAGADPFIGRQLPVLCQAGRFQNHVYFFDRYEPPQAEYLQFLSELPMDDKQRRVLQDIREGSRCGAASNVAHLPFWMVVAKKLS